MGRVVTKGGGGGNVGVAGKPSKTESEREAGYNPAVEQYRLSDYAIDS